MKKRILLRLRRLATTLLTSFSVLLLLWLVSPLPKILATPETKVFEQAWQTVNDNFYDPNFNGVDWKAIREKYKQQAARSKSSQEVAVVINQMLSELHSSHTHFYTKDEPAYYQLLGVFLTNNNDLQKQLKNFLPNGKVEYSSIGAVTKDINGKTFVSAIIDGSPAAEAGLKVGDQILSVDNHSYQPIQSFTGKAGQKVQLSIQRSADPNSRKQIAIAPKIFDGTTMFLDAQKASVQVIQQENKKIGYIHIWSNAADPEHQQLQNELLYGRLKHADALILDLRDGWGGGDIDYLNIFTAQEGPSITSISRNGKKYTYTPQWKKPVAMVVNQGSRSSKEILAFGFQQHKIGALIGAKTTGAVLAGSPFIMQDGSLLYLAVANVFINEKERLEGKGVTPDIIVPFQIEYAQGSDPQKQKAIDTLVATLKRG